LPKSYRSRFLLQKCFEQTDRQRLCQIFTQCLIFLCSIPTPDRETKVSEKQYPGAVAVGLFIRKIDAGGG
jgi:hypothetical protein